MVNHRRSRYFTCQVLDLVEYGVLNKDTLIADLLGWMSEHEVEEFVRSNDLIDLIEVDEEEEEGEY